MDFSLPSSAKSFQQTLQSCTAELILERKAFFIAFSQAHIRFAGMSVYSIDLYQNTIHRAMLLHGLKKVKPSRSFHAHDTCFY